MGRIIAFMHVSLDGFVAGPNGEMNWIQTPPEMFEFTGQRINRSDTALYGRKTFQMMEGYWPVADQQPNATRHDIEHAHWYRQVRKVVVSKSMGASENASVRVIGGDLSREVEEVKHSTDHEILMFGSPTATHALMAQNLIDGYWLFINPVLLGQGIPLFKDIRTITELRLLDSTKLDSGVVALNYERPS